MIRNLIGDFPFIHLTRAIGGVAEQLVREVRPGVKGVTLWRTGKRAEPFALVSVVDTADCDAAEDLLHQYEDLVGQNPVPVTWEGKLLPFRVVVLHVEPLEEGIHQTLIGVGGVRGTSNGLCRCVWHLQPIDPDQDIASY
jgi:hypothetical protein